MNVKRLEITVDEDYAQMNVWTTDDSKRLEAGVFSKVLRAFNEVTQSVAFSHKRKGFWSITDPRNESHAQFIMAARWVVPEKKNNART